MPLNISSVTEHNSTTNLFINCGSTLNSEGQLVVVQCNGNRYAKYSSDLVMLDDVTVPNGVAFRDVAAKGEWIIIADKSDYSFHVIHDAGTYSHKISIPERPMGIAIYGSDIFATVLRQSKIVKVGIDASNSPISTIVMAVNIALGHPMYLHVNSDKIVISDNGNSKVVAFDKDGKLLWSYGTYGSGDGQLKNPNGILLDPWNRYMISDGLNGRIVLVSSDGNFILNPPYPIAGLPKSLALIGNRLYVSNTDGVARLDVY
jgi:hypothetical protein